MKVRGKLKLLSNKKWTSSIIKWFEKIVNLIILDVSTHKLGKTYSNIRLEFKMPNTTSQINPLDQFFFAYLKSVFKKWLNSQYVESKFPEKMEKINNIINNKMVQEDRLLLIILDNVSTHKLG